MRRGICVKWGAGLALMLALATIPAWCAAEDNLTVWIYRDMSVRWEQTGQWAVTLTFNQPIFKSNLMEAVKATRDGVGQAFTVEVEQEQTKGGPAKRFRIISEKGELQPAWMRITVAKGLSDATGRLLLSKDYTFDFTLAEPVTVIGWTTTYKSRTKKYLRLSLSRSISETELAAAVKITPEVPGMKVTSEGHSGYRISGDFDFNKDYVLHISPTKVKQGMYALEAKEIAFKGPGLKPDIVARTERSVVELRGRQLFPITLTNVSKVRCKLTRIPAYFAADFLGAHPASLSPDLAAAVKKLETGRSVAASFLGEFSEDAEAFFAPEAKDHVLGYSLPLSFRKNPEHGGLWLATFSDPDGSFREEQTKAIQITDLSLSYKISGKTLLLWATSIHTGQPATGAQILVCDEQGYRYLLGKTDANGVLFVSDSSKFPAIMKGYESSPAASRPLQLTSLTWAVAATDNDACAVDLRECRLKPFAVKQVEALSEELDARTAYIFTERGVYRPGETVNFKFFARDYKDHRIVSPKGQVVKVQIVNPREDIVYTKELTLGDFGTCHDTFPVEKFFPTGTYTLTAKVGKDDEQTATCSRTFLVREFKRPRHVVSLTFKPGDRPGKDYVGVQVKEEFVTASVKAQYYTGGPVKHARVRWKAMLSPVTNKVPGYDGYTFGNEDSATLFLESGESMTNEKGTLDLTIPLDARLLTGIYGVEVSATVLDVDGEPATEVGTYQPKPRILVGISKHPLQVQNGYATPLKLLVVDSEGKKISQGKIQADVMRKSHFYTQKRDESGNINFLWEEGWMKGFSSSLAVSKGEALFDLQLSEFGDYLISFTLEDSSGKYTSQTCFKVGWEQYDEWSRRQSEKEVRTSNEVMLSTAKKEYMPGETVRVSFHVPRRVNKCLVAVEKGGVLEHRVIDVNGMDGNYEFTAKEAFRPNVFVSVLAAAGRQNYPVYQSQVDTDIPTVFYGYVDVAVRSDTKKFNLEIEPGVAELKARPADKKTLAMKVTDERGRGIKAELAVCVVDEAVLALTNFKTPELSSLTKFNLPLAVFSGDLRAALVSQDLFRILTTRPLTGGDGGLGALAASVKMRKDFRPVAYFNPSVLTDSSGAASVSFTLPDSTTAYRVYVVACDTGPGFASAQRNMVVSKEFFIEPSVPRFMIPGDKLAFPVSVNNKTAEQGQAVLEAESSKGLKLEPTKYKTDVPAWSASILETKAEALGGADTGTVRFRGRLTGKTDKFEDAIEQTFPFHSRYLPINTAIMGGFSKRTEVPLNLPEILKTLKSQDVTAGDLQANISLSLTNWSRIVPAIQYLLHYPYGCVEQTSSGVIPLAGIRGLVKSGKIPGIALDGVDRFLQAGVERLLSMQVASGGFGYWPGDLRPSWWGTMYATFALTAAKEGGFPVPEKNMKAALKYLNEGLFKKTETDEFHGGSWTQEFAMINLAIGGMLSKSDFEPYFSRYDSLTEQGKALLLLAARKTDYMPADKIRELVARLNPKYEPEKAYYYDSTVRQMAICLMAAVEAGVKDKADSWASQLMASIKPEGRWFSTADTGWALLALSDFFKGTDAHKSKEIMVRIDCGSDKPKEIKLSESSAYVELPWEAVLNKGKIILESGTDLLVNYTISLTYPDIITDPSRTDKGFTLSKRIENLNGKDEIRVGDMVRVFLDMNLRDRNETGGQQLEYLVLEDPVPAGLVPISSELKTEGVEKKESSDDRASWYEGYYDLHPSYTEFREDGVRAFKNRVWGSKHRYSYLARAVAAGDFWMRGSRVSLMYDPDVFGKTLGERITILPAQK